MPVNELGMACPYMCGATVQVVKLHSEEATRKNLTLAMQKHYMERHFKGFECSQCGKVFKRKKDLAEHAEYHEWRIKYLDGKRAVQEEDNQLTLFELNQSIRRIEEH